MTLTLIFIGIALGGLVGFVMAMIFDNDDMAEATMLTVIVGLILCIASIVWNELDDPEHGTVTGKDFVEEHWVCAKTCWEVSDSWFLELDDDGNVGWVEVREPTYNNFNEGDYFGGTG